MSDHSTGAEQSALPPTTVDGGGQTTPTRPQSTALVERSPMHLAQVIGGQYIITSPTQQQGVPPLTQVIIIITPSWKYPYGYPFSSKVLRLNHTVLLFQERRLN